MGQLLRLPLLRYKGVRLISAEPLGFDPTYSNVLMYNEQARNQIDIIAGHIYGHPPLNNLKESAKLAAKYGKEVWMTEHSVTDNLDNRLPNWHEQLLFAEEVNECMVAGCTGYIYWYLRAQWSFVGNGESKYGPDNAKNKLLPRAYVMSHFSKYLPGATRLNTNSSIENVTNGMFEHSAYIKGDSIIVMAIDTTKNGHNLRLRLPYKVMSGTQLVSTGNEKESLCQEQAVEIAEPTDQLTISLPGRSLSTFVFRIDDGTAIKELKPSTDKEVKTYYDLHGRRLETPHGLCIEKYADGTSRKVIIKD